MSESSPFPKPEFSRRGSIALSLLASAAFTIHGAATDNLQTINWSEGGDTTEAVLEHTIDVQYLSIQDADPNASEPFPRCQIDEYEFIERSKTPEEPKSIPLPILMPLPWIRVRKDEKDETEFTVPTSESDDTDSEPDVPLEETGITAEEPEKDDNYPENKPPLSPEEPVPPVDSQPEQPKPLPSVQSGYGGGRVKDKPSRLLRKRNKRTAQLSAINDIARKARNETIDSMQLGLLSPTQASRNLSRITNRQIRAIHRIELRDTVLPRIKIAGAVSLLAVAAGYGYKQSSFEAGTCFVDADKNSGAFDPGLNWHWDCDVSLPDLEPRIPAGGSSTGEGDNPCKDVPIYWDKDTIVYDTSGNIIETKDGKNQQISFMKAVDRINRAKNQGALVSAG